MQPLSKYSSTLIALAITITITLACAYLYLNRWQPPEADAIAASVPAGEPEAYSATVIRSIEGGTGREQFITRIVRSSEMRREEWSEQGTTRALIWRPDLGKCFLLAPEKQEYVETSLNAVDGLSAQPTSAATSAGEGISLESIDRAFSDAPLPATVETRPLADQVIENRTCQVIEQRRTYADGHAEITVTFHARDLNGLAIREESQSTAGGVKVITERRDIRTEVSPDEFAIPARFKRVDKLGR